LQTGQSPNNSLTLDHGLSLNGNNETGASAWGMSYTTGTYAGMNVIAAGAQLVNYKSGQITMFGTLTLAGDPTTNLQASTKQYVDNMTWTYAALPTEVAQVPISFPFTGALASAVNVHVPVGMV